MIGNDVLYFSYPDLKCVPARLRKMKITQLQPYGEPTLTDEKMEIKWRERIYDADIKDKTCDDEQENQVQEVVKSHDVKRLNGSRFVAYVALDTWKKLLKAVRSQNIEKVLQACIEVNDSMSRDGRGCVDDVSSETPGMAHQNQLCHFSLEVLRASVVKIQLSAELSRGLLTPCIQLLNLTPTLNICLEHRSDPVLCFADVEHSSVVKKSYRGLTLKQYREGWLYVVAIEAAKSSVKGEDSITIHNVPITWREEDGSTFGAFYLRTDFCRNRFIKFTSSDEDFDEEDMSLDFFCVRYSNMKKKTYLTDTRLDQYAKDFGDEMVWVGHCVSLAAEEIGEDKDMIKLNMRLFESKVAFPGSAWLNGQKATVEFMSKILPSR